MSNITRFGVSLESSLLEKFDTLISQKGYANRSEAIRDLIRDTLVKDEWEDDTKEVIGTITIIYDHHVRELASKKTAAEHVHYHQIISTMHLHLDHDHCLEVSAIKGSVKKVREIADQIIGMRGVKHGKLVITSTGKELK